MFFAGKSALPSLMMTYVDLVLGPGGNTFTIPYTHVNRGFYPSDPPGFLAKFSLIVGHVIRLVLTRQLEMNE